MNLIKTFWDQYIGLFSDPDNKVKLAAWAITIANLSFLITFLIRPLRQWLFGFFKKTKLESGIKSNNNQTQNIFTESKSVETYQISNIDPLTIKNEIKKAPLFQQEQIASHYIGLYVRWSLQLFQINKREKNNVNAISTTLNDRGYPDIDFDTNTDQYPFLKVANDSKKFEITGRIIKCSTYHISIDVITLKELN